MATRRSGGRKVCTKTGKRRYDSYWDARHAATSIRHAMNEEHGKPYKCDECKGWHLGRPQSVD